MPQALPRPRWRTISVDGRTVEYAEVGTGDPLLFLHGWGLTPRAYLPAVTRLCRAGVRVIAPSLPGFGRSAAAPHSERTIGGYARIAGRFLDELAIEKPVFVMGHSFGGGIAIQLATDRPDLVRSLTLVNSVGGAPGRPRLRNQQGMESRAWWQWAVGAMAEVSPREIARLGPRSLLSLGLDVARDLAPNLARHPVTALRTALVALGADLAGSAQSLVDSGLPVLFIWGDHDKLIAPGAFADIVNEVSPEIVQGRHGWLLTAPDEFAQLLQNALVVHALLERSRRGMPMVVEPTADLFPPERRRRARLSRGTLGRSGAS